MADSFLCLFFLRVCASLRFRFFWLGRSRAEHASRPLAPITPRSIKVVTILTLCLLATGCVRTAHPVLKDEQVFTNDALLGKWVSDDGKVSGELKPGGDIGQYKLSYTNEDGKTGNFVIRLGKFGDKTVAEIRADAFPNGTNGEAASLELPLYTMVVIEKTTPKVVLSAIDVDWFKKYTQSHPDELDVTGLGDQELIVNSSTDSFQAFCDKHFKDAGMLVPGKTFVHPGDAAAPAQGK